MRREGNKILFDSESQQDAFEKTMNATCGANKLLSMLLETIGEAIHNASGWWKDIEDAIEFQPGERLVYLWTTRELIIRRDTESGVKEP